jgi:small subunit ribosomal protein S6
MSLRRFLANDPSRTETTMQGYESIFILDPETGEEDQTGLIEKFKALVGSNGGQVVHHTTWGRRKLAYEVKKREYGFYHLFYMDKTPEALRALENTFRIDDNVIKWQSVSVEDVDKEHGDFERLKTEGSMAQKLSEG